MQLCYVCNSRCACEYRDKFTCAGGPPSECPCSCHKFNWNQWEKDKALHTAAPDLLAALKALVERFGIVDWDSVHDSGAFEDARAAIAKAEGTERPSVGDNPSRP